PPGISSHDLYHHYAIMCLCGGVNAVDRFTDDVAGSVEAEGIVCATEIIVDRLRYANHFHSFFVKLLRYRKRIVTSDGYQGVELMFLDRRDAAVETVRAL